MAYLKWLPTIVKRDNAPSVFPYSFSMTTGKETSKRNWLRIAMVMGNTYAQNTLVFDHIHRRDAQSEGIGSYLANESAQKALDEAEADFWRVRHQKGEKLNVRETLLNDRQFRLFHRLYSIQRECPIINGTAEKEDNAQAQWGVYKCRIDLEPILIGHLAAMKIIHRILLNLWRQKLKTGKYGESLHFLDGTMAWADKDKQSGTLRQRSSGTECAKAPTAQKIYVLRSDKAATIHTKVSKKH
ncbi:hypothetical protein CFAM422_011431 [Trichoderma lentiforme]|uniref:Uncharacterized protein n=1 Tax=Trichoderma lentiforme TaxID=1567552 RepID=A0A9P4X5N9_9HYPO|nr:hypothetical protein CFAM422_011431 [Trichoderma lentiforme]